MDKFCEELGFSVALVELTFCLFPCIEPALTNCAQLLHVDLREQIAAKLTHPVELVVFCRFPYHLAIANICAAN